MFSLKRIPYTEKYKIKYMYEDLHFCKNEGCKELECNHKCNETECKAVEKYCEDKKRYTNNHFIVSLDFNHVYHRCTDICYELPAHVCYYEEKRRINTSYQPFITLYNLRKTEYYDLNNFKEDYLCDELRINDEDKEQKYIKVDFERVDVDVLIEYLEKGESSNKEFDLYMNQKERENVIQALGSPQIKGENIEEDKTMNTLSASDVESQETNLIIDETPAIEAHLEIETPTEIKRRRGRPRLYGNTNISRYEILNVPKRNRGRPRLYESTSISRYESLNISKRRRGRPRLYENTNFERSRHYENKSPISNNIFSLTRNLLASYQSEPRLILPAPPVQSQIRCISCNGMYLEKDIFTHLCSMPDPKAWSVTQVREFINKSTNSVIGEIFQDNEIDGRALLLLTYEHLKNILNIKLGPSLIISKEINKLNQYIKKM